MKDSENQRVEAIVVLCTCPPERALAIARNVLESRLVACVNIVERVQSLYWWEGKISEDVESLLVMKTTRGRFSELAEAVQAIHPYTVPEVIALPIGPGNKAYLDWVATSTEPGKGV